MTTYGNSTIHSKLAKFQRTKEQMATGRVVKGVNSQFGILRTNKNYWSNPSQQEIMKQIQVLPKSKLNIARKMKNKRVIPGINRNDQIVLMQSSIFPAIYFKKTSLRNVLKQFSFPENCRQMPSQDDRTALIYQIISNIFNEINFYIFNIIVGQNLDNRSYYVFFSDCETLPFTKCCNAPVFMQLQQNGSGKILCNSTSCKHPSLAEFLINFDDGKKLWPNISYFAQASNKDKQLKQKISKLIINGKYKRQSLVQMVQDTSKQIVNLFYQSKNITKKPSHVSMHDENTFLTGGGMHNNMQQQQQNQQIQYDQQNQTQTEKQLISEPPEPQENQQVLILEQQDQQKTKNNVQTLKMKLKYITKKQTDLSKRLSKKIVEQSLVFQHNFDMIRKIDEQMLKNRNARTASKITFPQLMNQINRRSQKQVTKQFQKISHRETKNKTFHI